MKWSSLGQWLQRSLPNRCYLCQQPVDQGIGLCRWCLADAEPGPLCLSCSTPLPQAPPWRCGRCQSRRRWRPLVCAYPYHSPMGYLCGSIKIHQQLGLIPPLCDALAERWQALWESGAIDKPKALVPVPMHRSRLPLRGFNHAVLLADALGQRLQLPVRDDLLVKVRATMPQHDLSGAARRRNLAQAFAATKADPVEEIAVVDDIATTGATLAAVAAALRRGGHQISQYAVLASAMAR